MARSHGLIVALALAGCQGWGRDRPSILPTQLSLLVEDTAGRPLSVVMDLRRNTRDQIDVRVSEGVRLFDGEHLWRIEMRKAADGFRVHLSDDLGGVAERDLPLRSATEPRLISLDWVDGWIETSGGLHRCALQKPVCASAAETGRAPLDHPGPGRGFRVELDSLGDLRLILPLDAEDGGQAILHDVARVIGAHWVHEDFLHSFPVLDRTFRGRASLVAIPRVVTVDGRFDEWSDAEPLIVEAPWQIDAGATAWEGSQDASFSVTASRSTEGVCFAGRVRDDHFVVGDEMRLRVGTELWTLPVSAPGRLDNGVVRDEWFGRRFEACYATPLPASGHLAFYASFADTDPGGEQTLLASAPVQDAGSAGTLRVSP